DEDREPVEAREALLLFPVDVPGRLEARLQLGELGQRGRPGLERSRVHDHPPPRFAVCAGNRTPLRARGMKDVQRQFGKTAAAYAVATCRVAAHHFTEPARAFAEIARVLRPGGILVLVDNYAPDEPELDAFINTLETLRDASHVRNQTLDGWRALVEDAGMRATIDSTAMVTKLSTDAWLARSQTPPDRAARVRAMLRDAPAAAVERFGITPTEFAVPKVVLVGRR